jgi:hypothetical protein
MAGRDDNARGAARVLDADEVQGVLSGSFYAPLTAPAELGGGRMPGGSGRDDADRPRVRKAEPGPKPAHYKVICISLYTKDLERLDALVDELKARGLTKANRSALIRAALDQVQLDKVPRGI